MLTNGATLASLNEDFLLSSAQKKKYKGLLWNKYYMHSPIHYILLYRYHHTFIKI